jgi:hypothetical protein
MKRFSRLLAIFAIAGTAAFYAGTASAFFGFDDWFDPWDDGPYYGYPGYGYGGYPGYGYGGYPGYAQPYAVPAAPVAAPAAE